MPREENKRSATLRLLNEGETFLTVAIKLNLTPQQVEGIYLNLMQLKCMNDFIDLYDRVRDDLPNFNSFYNSCQSRVFLSIR